MNESPVKPQPMLKDRLDTLCREMIDKGILFSEAMDQFERCFITEVMRRNNGRLIRASGILGIHRNTLSKKVRCRKKLAN